MRRLPHLAGLLIAALLASLLAPAVATAQTDIVGYRSHPHFGDSEEVGGPATCCKAESKLWFHDGTWWATMIHLDSSTHRIHRLSADVWVDTGVEVDSHLARADVLHVGDTIWITGRNTSKLARFTYAPGSSSGMGSWTLDSGFPVDLPVGATPGLTIARDSTGVLWIGWLDAGVVTTSYSTDGGASWSSPAALPFPEAVSARSTDYAAITAMSDANGPGIGVMWSNQNDDAQYFAVHRDGETATSWTIETALSGDNEADDHINFATFEDRVYATVKTSHYESGRELIKLLARTPQGVWTQTPVARVEDGDTRPIGVIDIDPAARRIYVFTRVSDDAGTRIVYRSSPLSGLSFPTEATTILRADRSINDVTSMKANATADSGIVVMAETSREYWWNRVGDATTPPDDPEVSLDVTTVGQGTVTRDPADSTYPLGTEVTLTATAANGWYFDGWSGAASGSNPVTTVVMDGDRSVTATFLEDTGEPPPSGQVEFVNVSTGEATNSSSVQTETGVSAGPGAVYVAAVATRGSAVPSSITGLGLTWTEVTTQCSGRGSSRVSMWAAAGDPASSSTVQANLTSTAAAATIAVSRYAGGDVSAPVTAGIGANSLGVAGACKGGSDGASYSVATPHGAGSGLVVAATTMRNRSHTATSPATERAEISTGTGGRVNSLALLDRGVGATSPTSIAGTYSGATDWATVATTIRPSGSSGGGGGGGTTQYTLSTSTVGSGTVTSDPAGGVHDAGTVVELTATPASGWSFAGWSGDASGTSSTVSVTMDADRSVTATFTDDGGGGTTQYSLSTSTVGSGTVTSDPAGGVHDAGTVVELTATPASGWSFAGWNGDASGTSSTVSVTMDADRSVTATFTDDGGGGTTSEVTFESVSTGVSESSTSVTSSTVTAAGDAAYVAAIGHRGGSATVTDVSGLGLTWTPVIDQCTGRNASRVSVWIATGTPSANGPVTATLSASVAAATIAVGRYAGVDVASPVLGRTGVNSNGVDGSCFGGTDGASYQAAAPTDVGSGLVVGAATMRNKSHAPDPGVTERAEVGAGSGGSVASVALVDRAPEPTATTLLSGTFSSSTDWGVVALTLRGAEG